ncbi:MAG: hypothetical protein J7L37_05620 [Thermococcus sp.]|nr:hypothetical protein [Thermococcus sp.]
MLFAHYSGLSTGEFWEDPLKNVLKGLLMSSGLVMLPAGVSGALFLIKRTSIYVAMAAAFGAELLLAGLAMAAGYPKYSKDAIAAVLAALPVALILAWVLSRNPPEGRIDAARR